jgi:hypothetical protein
MFPGADYAGVPRLFGDLLSDTGTCCAQALSREPTSKPNLAAGTRDKTFSIQLTYSYILHYIGSSVLACFFISCTCKTSSSSHHVRTHAAALRGRRYFNDAECSCNKSESVLATQRPTSRDFINDDVLVINVNRGTSPCSGPGGARGRYQLTTECSGNALHCYLSQRRPTGRTRSGFMRFAGPFIVSLNHFICLRKVASESNGARINKFLVELILNN